MFNLAILRHNRLRPVSNYLFGIVFRVFPTRSRFHKFQYCSIFKVLRQPPRGQLIYYISSSFFCQALFEIFLSRPAFRPARCLGDSLFILLHPRSFVKTFFEVFSSSFSNRSADPVAHALSVTVLRGRPEAVQL